MDSIPLAVPYYRVQFPESLDVGTFHYLLYLYNKHTGQRRVFLHDWAFEMDDPAYGVHARAEYYFSEGNGNCDCNRSWWFFTNEEYESILLDDEPVRDGYPCDTGGDDKKIWIEKIICLETGETICVNV